MDRDARLKRVLLTDMGIQTHEKIESLVDCLNIKTLEGISDEELEVFFRVTQKLEENLKKQKAKWPDGKEETNDSDFIERG